MSKFSQQQIRSAILKAAAHIERNPSQYSFINMRVPGKDCGTIACMWGWVGFFLGAQPDEHCHILGDGEGQQLYDFCKGLSGSCSYQDDAQAAARGLRAYAEAKYPADQGPLVAYDLLPLADYYDFLQSVRNGEEVEEVGS